MKIKSLLCLVVSSFFYAASTQAQESNTIKGIVIDSASNIKLQNTTVSILNTKDSTLVKFTRTAENGSFSISSPGLGKFILLVSYPGYADYVENFQLDSLQRSKDFKQINMTLKATLLADVIIRGKVAAIKIKGDTTEFNAGSFVIEPNSRVEDLLKQLPGIQVDKDGKITAHGQTVNKVLVDGEEFFGDDPTLVTKNIRSDMVDKIQLYDKKSDQATFTGIDDGVTAKTINLKLKEDKKNGYFGKIDVGAGTDEFYQGQAMFNAFKAKQKFSAYGTLGNTGKTGLNWRDRDKYGGSSMNVEFSEDGGMMFYGGGGDELDRPNYNGQGIPFAATGGLHYDTKFDSDKQTLNTNYKIGTIQVEGVRNSLTQNNLPTGIINSASDQQFENNTFMQKIDATYFAKLDTTSTIKVAIDGSLGKTGSKDIFSSSSSRGDNTLLNSSERRLSDDGNQQQLNISALYTKKLKKTGRTYTVNVTQALRKQYSEGFLNSENVFYNSQGDVDSTQNIDQYKTNNTSSSILNSNITYTEPLYKNLALTLNYGLGINNTGSDKRSFNQTAPGQYNQLDTVFSNNFDLNQLTNQGGAMFNYRKNKTTINFGSKATNVRFSQYDAFRDRQYTRNFINWNPKASYLYKFSQQASFRLDYNGNNSQPRIDQIQPIQVNTDPLNITIGNADLDPSFTNRFNVSYNTYKVLSERSMYFGGSYSFTSNSIVSNTTTDAAGKSTYQAINMTDKMPSNFYAYGEYSKKIKAIDANLGLSFNTSGNTNYNYINNALNTSTAYSFSGGLSLSKYKAKKYGINLTAGPMYTTGESSLQQINNNGWGFNGNGSANLNLPGKVEIRTDARYQFTAATASFNEDFERMIWNASIVKKFFKQENLSISLSGNDLLNQNVGFSRNAWSNRITQNSYTTIQRYFLLSLVWDFNKMGGTPTQK